MEETEAPKPVARSNSSSTMKSDGKNDTASAAKGEADETAAESTDVKDIMKLLVRDAKKAAALAVEPTVSTSTDCRISLLLRLGEGFLPRSSSCLPRCHDGAEPSQTLLRHAL